jgi:hypothetical protein
LSSVRRVSALGVAAGAASGGGSCVATRTLSLGGQWLHTNFWLGRPKPPQWSIQASLMLFLDGSDVPTAFQAAAHRLTVFFVRENFLSNFVILA